MFLPRDVVQDWDLAALDDVGVGAGERGVVPHEVGGVVVAEGAEVVGVGAVGGLLIMNE